jgi:hypothetical protein
MNYFVWNINGQEDVENHRQLEKKTIMSAFSDDSRTGVSNTWCAGLIWPAKGVNAACNSLLN